MLSPVCRFSNVHGNVNVTKADLILLLYDGKCLRSYNQKTSQLSYKALYQILFSKFSKVS